MTKSPRQDVERLIEEKLIQVQDELIAGINDGRDEDRCATGGLCSNCNRVIAHKDPAVERWRAALAWVRAAL